MTKNLNRRNGWAYPSLRHQTESGTAYLSIPDLPLFISQADDLQHPVRNGDRIDLLASTYYGDARLWWPILVANQIDDSINGLVPGSIITIPSMRYVRERISRIG